MNEQKTTVTPMSGYYGLDSGLLSRSTARKP